MISVMNWYVTICDSSEDIEEEDEDFRDTTNNLE